MCRLIALVLAIVFALPVSAQVTQDPDGEGVFEERESESIRIERREVRFVTGGRIEYMTSGPANQANAAAEALQAQGARVVRTRNFPALGRFSMFFDLGPLSLDQARAILAPVAPQTLIGVHALYRFAQGKPRLYAANMINAPVDTCQLRGIRIGVIDGAIDPRHPALAGVRVVTHSVLPGGATNPNHGTAVAALIAGKDPNGVFTGFAAGADLYVVTAFGSERNGPGADVERVGAALDWLLSQNVRLINMSFAGPPNTVMNDLLNAAAARGAIMVAAAGNDGAAIGAFPAAAGPVIAVTAVDAAGRRYVAANTGPHIEFAAPGVDLYVAQRNGGNYASGTSFAAPIVTALAARLMARGVGTVDGIRARLRSQSSDLGIPGRDTSFGWGLAHANGC